MCICGSVTIELIKILRAAVFLYTKRATLGPVLLACNELTRVADRWIFVDQECGSYARDKGIFPWLTIVLQSAGTLAATEPRDEVYGLLGMLSPRQPSDDLRSLIMPDYNRSVAHVYRDATRYAIFEGHATLHILTLLSHRTSGVLQLEGFASWVPRLDHNWDFKHDPGSFKYSVGFLASDGQDSQLYVDDDLDVLRLGGTSYSAVAEVTDVFKTKTYSGMAAMMLQVLRVTKEPTPNEVPMPQYFPIEDFSHPHLAPTLIANTNVEELPATSADISAFDAFLVSLYHATHDRLPDTIDSEDSEGIQAIVRQTHRYELSFTQACMNRRFFKTASGSLGIGPQAMRPGDIVAVLYGGDIPYVLRPVDDKHYQLLGPAYVHGIMYGELVHRHQDKGGVDEIFALR